MREIKFRGKRVSDGRWVTGFYFTTPLSDEDCSNDSKDGLFFLCGVTRHVISQNNCTHQVIPETVGEFTGLKDKNGVEIFEGDSDKHGNVVEYLNGVFCLNGDRALICLNGNRALIWLISEFEVATNIHDNPELLK